MMRCMLDAISKIITDLSWNFDLNGMAFFPSYRNAHLARDLARVLHWLLVALSILLGMALRSRAVTIARLSFGLGLGFSICLTLSVPKMSTISSMSMSNNLRVVTHDSRAVMNLSVSCVALGGECFLALFNISCVNNSLADRAGNLALILYWPLVALPVLLVMALRTSGVSWLSLTLTIPSMSMSHYLGVMANNSRAVVDLLRCLLTMSGDDVLTILDISGVYDNIIFLMASLFIGNVVLGVAMFLLVAICKVSTTRGTLGKGCEGKDGDNSQHDYEIFPSV